MGLIAVCTVKGAAGATTTALGLAAVLPAAAGALVVECDASGGDLGLRYRLPARDGLVAAAGAARSLTSPDQGEAGRLLGRYGQSVPVGDGAVEVVAGPAGGRQARATVQVLAEHPAVVNPAGRVVVADCGRLEPGSPVWPLLTEAQVVLLVLPGTVGAVSRVVDVADDLTRAAQGRVGLVLAEGGVYGADQVTATLGEWNLAVSIAGRLPDDPRTAAVLAAGKAGSARWRRWPLGSALTLLADAVYTSGPPEASEPATEAERRTEAGPPTVRDAAYDRHVARGVSA